MRPLPVKPPASLCSCLLLLIALLIASPTPSYGLAGKHALRKDAKRQIEDMETQWRDAQLTGNVSEMERLLSEDYFGISMTGQVNTKDQQLDRIRKRTLVLSKIELSDVKVKLIGKTAVVTSRAEVEGMNDGVPMQGSFRYTRVYQRTPSGSWKITNFEATRLAQPRQPSGEGLAQK
jgi:ketosteroid isomerase-like protein